MPQLYQPEKGSNVHAMLRVMQYTLSTGIKQKRLQHIQETYCRKTVKDY